MKKINKLKASSVTAGFLGLMLINGAASANFGDFKFYAGAGLDYNNYGLGEFAKSFKTHKTNGLSLAVPILGVKFNENFGLEFGYGFNKKFKMANSYRINGVNGDLNFDVKTRNSYLDLVGFMPVADQIDLIGGIGLGHLKIKSLNGTYNTNPRIAGSNLTITTKSKTSWRVKVGAQYNVNNNLGIRTLATYQHVGSDLGWNFSAPGRAPVKKEGKFIKNMKSIGLDAVYTF